MINVRVKSPTTIFLPVLILGLTILPLVWWANAPVPFELPRVWFFNRWIEILVLVGLLQAFTKISVKRLDTRLITLIILFFLAAVLSSVVTGHFYKSFWGNYYRSDGLFTLAHLVGLSLLLSLLWEDSWAMPVAIAVALGSILTSSISLFELWKIHISRGNWVNIWQVVLGSTFGQPNFLGGYILISLPFTLYLFQNQNFKKFRLLAIPGLLIQISALFLTHSWGAVMGLILLGLMYILFSKRHIYQKVFAVSLISLILIGLLYSYIWQTYKQGFVAESRSRIFHKLSLSIVKKPIFGWGWANVDYAFEESVWPIRFTNDIYLDKAHSDGLEILTTTGILGLIIYVLVIITILRKIRKKLFKQKNQQNFFKTLFLVFILFLFHSQTNVISINEELFFWFIAGIAANN